MVSNNPFLKLAVFFCLVFCGGVSLSADEVVISDGLSNFSVGDFRCTSCSDEEIKSLGILSEKNSGAISAGELWKFFDEQGVQSLDRLTLCLDLEAQTNNFDLQSMELKIEDPFHEGKLLTHVSMGDASLVVPARETSSFKPEAKMEILLGYDFMQQFSAESTEQVHLNFSSNSDAATVPSISFAGSDNLFSSTNSGLLLGFVGFWVVVFFVLNRATKPMVEAVEAAEAAQQLAAKSNAESAGVPAPHTPAIVEENKRALSA